MQLRRSAIAAAAAAALLGPAGPGCGPADVGSVEAPADYDRTLGPTTDPNQPGGGSVIPSEDVKSRKKSRAPR